jgi:tartrate-resistant acid phosphatase type 5
MGVSPRLPSRDARRRALVLAAVVMVVVAVDALARWESPPDVPPAAGTRFAVIGDYGNGSSAAERVAGLLKSWKVEFVTTVGDNNYPRGARETLDAHVGKLYHGYIHPYAGSYGRGADRNRFFPSPGHVDWDTESLAPYLEYFTLPGNERYYDFLWGPVHFFMLDTDKREPDGAHAGSTQARWLEKALATSRAPWKLVYSHHGPYTSHSHGDIKRMRWPFAKWGADAVLSGFYHVYERLEVDGIPYFIVGLGGRGPSKFGETDPHSRVRYNDGNGALFVDASAHALTFRMVALSGDLVDVRVLRKDVAR